jgi:PncC family amidohydrolase
MALGLDVFMAIERTFGVGAGVGLGASFFILAITFWYVLEFAIRENKPMRERHDGTGTPLSAKVEQMLTEARVIIPGAQALLGFQLTVTLTRAFEQIPFESKLAHAAALCCIALSVILLMAPAALHRISFAGEDSADFLKVGSVFIVAAPLPLALGIALDTYVAIAQALESNLAATSVAGTTAIVLTLLWYAYPVWRRINPGTSQPTSEAFNSMQQSLAGDLALAAVRVLGLAKKRNLTIVTAESCTAGMLSTLLSEAPGASEHLHGGFVTYTKENKTKVLGVSEHLLTEKSAVCTEVTIAMAEGALRRSPADLAVAVTGVAGPEPDEDGNPVGRACIAVARRGTSPLISQGTMAILPGMPCGGVRLPMLFPSSFAWRIRTEACASPEVSPARTLGRRSVPLGYRCIDTDPGIASRTCSASFPPPWARPCGLRRALANIASFTPILARRTRIIVGGSRL